MGSPFIVAAAIPAPAADVSQPRRTSHLRSTLYRCMYASGRESSVERLFRHGFILRAVVF